MDMAFNHCKQQDYRLARFYLRKRKFFALTSISDSFECKGWDLLIPEACLPPQRIGCDFYWCNTLPILPGRFQLRITLFPKIDFVNLKVDILQEFIVEFLYSGNKNSLNFGIMCNNVISIKAAQVQPYSKVT